MTDGGRFVLSPLSAPSTLRFILCLVTESLAVFLDTTTAYPSVSLGKTAVKFNDENRRPLLRAVGNAEREMRFCLGNTLHYADRRLRPILRRFCTILRPDAVLLRERKPWVFARLRFFG